MRILIENINGDPWEHQKGEDSCGQNLFVFYLAHFLASQGHFVDVATRWTNEQLKKEERWGNLRLLRIEAGPALFLHRDLLEDTVQVYSDQLLSHVQKEGGYDVIHGNYWLSIEPILTLKRAGLSKSLIYTPHSLGIEKAQKGNMVLSMKRIPRELDILEHADCVHVFSRDEKKLVESFGCNKRVAIIPHGVDHCTFFYIPKLQARSYLGWKTEDKILLFVGRWEKQKNLPFCLKLFDELFPIFDQKETRLRLVIVGGEMVSDTFKNLPGKIKDTWDTLKYKDHIEWMGPLSNKELKWIYAAADALCMPSYYEPFGLAALECLSCGTPVIASAVGGLKTTVKPNKNGFLCLVEDLVSFRSRIKQVLTDVSWLTEYRRKNISSSVSEFTWEKAGSALEQVYASIQKEKIN